MAANPRWIAVLVVFTIITALTLTFLSNDLLDSDLSHGPQHQVDQSFRDDQSFMQQDHLLVRGALRSRGQNLQKTQISQELPTDRMMDIEMPDVWPFNLPSKVQDGIFTGSGWGGRIVFQLIFGLLFWWLVVSQYPLMQPSFKPSPDSITHQGLNPMQAVCYNTTAINCLSWCCPGAIGALTLDAVGIPYTIGLLSITCLPCCTLCLVEAFTDLNTRLGGKPMGIIPSLFYSCCCSCCLIGQHAQSLDLITGAATGCCGVYELALPDQEGLWHLGLGGSENSPPRKSKHERGEAAEPV